MKRIFVAQMTDLCNNNAQVLNARAMLARFDHPDIEWVVPAYNNPDPDVAMRPNVKVVRLVRNRFWKLHKFLLHQGKIDAIFYPTAYWFDAWAIIFRRLCGRKVPVICTIEGLIGNTRIETKLSLFAGHPVGCQHLAEKQLHRSFMQLKASDCIISISPFLKRMSAHLLNVESSTIPLGIESRFFHSKLRKEPERFTVLSAGSLYDGKRPEAFVELAVHFPDVIFKWFGDGNLRERLVERVASLNLKNVFFPGAISNAELAAQFCNASIFVLPSHSEGVPKVSQEAAACGLPVILFGYYEAPSVVDGENGFVVWSDEELEERLKQLSTDPKLVTKMGNRGAEMAKEWSWDSVAGQWETEIFQAVTK